MSIRPRNVGMTVLVAIVHVWLAMIVEVLARTFDPIVKSTPLNLVKLIRRRIPCKRRRGRNHRTAPAHQVRHRPIIPAPKSVTVSLPLFGRKMRIAVFIPVIDIGPAMIIEILPCTLYPVMKPLPLNRVQLLRRYVPSTIAAIVLEPGAWLRRCGPCRRSRQKCSQRNHEHRSQKSLEMHRSISFRTVSDPIGMRELSKFESFRIGRSIVSFSPPANGDSVLTRTLAPTPIRLPMSILAISAEKTRIPGVHRAGYSMQF